MAEEGKKKKLGMSDLEALRAGGVYIPPFKLRRLQAKLAENKKSQAYQRLQWEALRKSINGPINKANKSNIKHVVVELLQQNIVRARGLFCRSLMKAQMASPSFTAVYASLLSIVNSKIPEIGELLCKRVISQFQRAYRRNDKVSSLFFFFVLVRRPLQKRTEKVPSPPPTQNLVPTVQILMKSVATLLAHLINHQILHELCGLQLLQLLLTQPTDDSVEVAKEFTLQCGQTLQTLAPKALKAVFDTMRKILQEVSGIDVRVQYELESLFEAFRTKFEVSSKLFFSQTKKHAHFRK